MNPYNADPRHWPFDPRPQQRAEVPIVLPEATKQAEHVSTNPKDAIGRSKAPLQLVPAAFMAATALGLHNGATKYGIANWREHDVAASVYVGAILRHLTAWYEGEEEDPDDDVWHLAACAAGLAILVDAHVGDNLVDDRPASNYHVQEFFDEVAEEVRRINKMREAQNGDR